MKTLFVALRAVVVSSAFISLWGWIAWTLHLRYDPALGLALPQWTRPLGIALLAAGGALALACIATFVARGEGTPAPFDPPRKFVAAGPYKFVRNPMYIAGYTALFGYGLFEHSLTIVLFTLPWLLLAHLFVMLYEEPHLRSTFGAPYEDYCRSVHRWLPRL
jgi:protein-S-isoprenylcysteine O-methyltransferase Ste14